jgi:hypothetical protein
MAKLCTIAVVLALAAPAAALAAPSATGDGSVALASATGTIWVKGSGVIYGHFDSGTLLVLDYKPDDGSSMPAVSGAKLRVIRGSYSGTDVRFLLPSGRYSIELITDDLNASGVGKGSVVATGLGTPDDGTLSVNGGKPLQLGVNAIALLFGSPKTPTTTTSSST